MVEGAVDANGHPLTAVTIKSWVSSTTALVRSVRYCGEQFIVFCNDRWLCCLDLIKWADRERRSVFCLEAVPYEKIEGEVAMSIEKQERYLAMLNPMLAAGIILLVSVVFIFG